MSILVIGDSCEDYYVYGKCERMCPDAPVPVFHRVKTVTNGGMALHVSENLTALGAGCDIITQTQRIFKTRYVDIKSNHMFLRVDSDVNPIKPIVWSNYKTIDLKAYDAIIISDYNKGFLSEKDIERICKSHDRVFIDTKKHLGKYCEKAFIIKINELEFQTTEHTLTEKLRDKLIVTLGNRGATYKCLNFPVQDVEVKDMTGAGDTFISSLCHKFVETDDLLESIKYANKCATIVVQQRGVTVIDPKEIS